MASARSVVNWGVIGACGIARRRTIPEGIMPAGNARLVALMDVNHDGVRRMADEHGVCAYTTVEALLEHAGVDAVYIATPNCLHREQIAAAARSGKHVLCEKPLALTTAEIQEAIAVCKAARVLLGVGFMMRFNVYHERLRDLIRNGDLGVPLCARGQMTSWHPPAPGAWRHAPEQSGGGCLQDVGSHIVDVLEMLLGRTTSVYCQCAARVHHSPVEDTAVMQLTFASGAFGMADMSFAMPSKANEYVLEVYGSKGAVKCKYTLSQKPGGEVRACILSDLGSLADQEKARYDSGYEPLELAPRSTYQAEIEAFSQAVLDGRPAPVSGEDGLWNHLVIQAAYESARTGRPVVPGLE